MMLAFGRYRRLAAVTIAASYVSDDCAGAADVSEGWAADVGEDWAHSPS